MTGKISVVIPVYNAGPQFGDCLRALGSQSLPRESFKIIVVDDGSSDDSAAVAEGFGVRVIRQENRGAPAARNTGIDAAEHPWVAFTDADCIPTRRWLEYLYRAIDGAPDGREPIGAAGPTFGYQSNTRVARFVDLTKGLDAERHLSHPKWPFAPTGNVMYRRDALVEIGGFDERFVAYDACDLHTRMSRPNMAFVFEPRAVVLHRHRASWGTYFQQQVGYGHGLGQFTLRYRHEIGWSLWNEMSAWGQLVRLGAEVLKRCEADESLVNRGNAIKAFAQRIGFLRAYWSPTERHRWNDDALKATRLENASS